MQKEYRLVLIYSDGSVHPLKSYPSREKLEMTVRAVARKPGVRYCCEEWAEVQSIEGGACDLKSVNVYEL
jgi:hypothetical protein